jgi:tetratricopeptide (TPR) repeat protein
LEISPLKRNLSLLFYLLGTILIFVAGCHSKNSESNPPAELETYDFNSEFLPQDVQKIKNAAIKALMPIVSGKDKEELIKIIKYLDDTQEKAPAYFEVSKNSIEFLKTLMQLALIEGRIKPLDYNANFNISIQYLQIARTIRQFDPSEADTRLSIEYEKKGLRTAHDLVAKFPDNGASYGHLAHSLYTIEGDTQKALELYKRCLELDEKLEFCQEGYDVLHEELNK